MSKSSAFSFTTTSILLIAGCSVNTPSESTDRGLSAALAPAGEGPIVLHATRHFGVSSIIQQGTIQFLGPAQGSLPPDAAARFLQRAQYVAQDGSTIAASVSIRDLKPKEGPGSVWTVTASKPLATQSSFQLVVKRDSALAIADSVSPPADGEPWSLGIFTGHRPQLAGLAYDVSQGTVTVVMTEPVTWTNGSAVFLGGSTVTPSKCMLDEGSAGCFDDGATFLSERALFQLREPGADVSAVQLKVITQESPQVPPSMVKADNPLVDRELAANAVVPAWQGSSDGNHRSWRASL